MAFLLRLYVVLLSGNTYYYHKSAKNANLAGFSCNQTTKKPENQAKNMKKMFQGNFCNNREFVE